MFFYQNIMVDDTQESPYILMHRIDELLGKINISYGILYVKYILYYSSKVNFVSWLVEKSKILPPQT